MEKIILYHPLNAPNGQEFDAEHAENLMNMTNNGGWTDKPIKKTVNVDNGANKGSSKKSEK